MVLNLGPCPAEDALDWSATARRIVAHLRSSADGGRPEVDDLLDLWSDTIDRWAEAARVCLRAERPFRWAADVEPELAEFLLAGLDRSLRSVTVRGLCTDDEIERQRPFTVQVIRSFIDGLAAESDCCRQYADQVSASLQDLLADSY